MNLTKISVKRPLTMIMVFCVIVVFGAMGYAKMPVNLMPDIDMPVATIMTTWGGASAEDVENQVTEIIEEAVSGISGVDSITTISAESMSAVMLMFDYDVDILQAMSSIRDKVALVTSSLPDSVSDPTISQVDINAAAISTLVVTSDKDSRATMSYAEDIVVPALEQISGVTSADISGGSIAKITVRANQSAMNHYGVTLSTLSSIISSGNMTFPYGTVTEGDSQFTLRTFEELTSVEDIEQLQVPTASGVTINLSEIADVTYGYEKEDCIYRYNGQPNLMLDISKQQSANTVQVMTKVVKKVAQLNEENPNYSLIIATDESEYISSSMSNVWSTMIISAIVAFFVILIFLKDLRASFIVALAIPLSIIGAVAALYFTGETLNLITVGGLVLGVGMVVDNSIVVIENIFKKRENKEITLEDACVTGTTSVGTAIMASTLTTIAVFLPLLFTSGMIKIMFGALSFSIIYALVFSILVALTLVPALFNKLSHNKKGKEVVEKATPIFDKFRGVYEGLLNICLTHRFIVILLSIALFAFTMSLIPQIGMDLMPSADKGTMSISIDLPKGVNIEDADYYVSMAEEKILPIQEIDTLTTSLDLGSSGLTTSSNTATLSITLVSQDNRTRSTKEVSKEIKELLSTVPDCEINVSLDDSMMGSSMSGFSINVEGSDLDILKVVALDVQKEFEKIAGLTDITNSLADETQEARIKLDQKKAAENGVNTSAVTSMLRLAIEGSDVTTAKINDYTVDVNLSLADGTIESLEDVLSLKVLSQTGSEIPIGSFATIEMASGSPTLQKSNGKYTVTISANLDGIDTSSAQAACYAALEDIVLPQGYDVSEGTMVEMMNESFSDLALALVIAVLLVYIVMVAQFESFKTPFIILFCVPFGFVGVIFSLILAGSSLSIPSFIGIILLVGIVVNNGIVLIDYIEQLREETSLSLKECIAKGSAARLRPVLMTTLTTVLAMIPMVMGIGEGSEMMQPMGVSVAGGLTFSTLITLVLIPTIYFIVEGHAERRKIKREQKAAAKSAQAA